jgi:hypothetical protein
MAIARFDVEFTKTGSPFKTAQVDALAAGLAGVTDLLVVSHGWNNDMADARALYDALLGNVSTILDHASDANAPAAIKRLAGRTYAACQVFWPSKKFANSDLIPGGGAASATTANDHALDRVLAALKEDPVRLGGHDRPAARVKAIDRAIKALGAIEHDPKARQTFVDAIRQAVGHGPSAKERDDGSSHFFEDDAETLFTNLAQPVKAPVGRGSGGATDVGSAGGAAGLGDLLSGAKAAARRIANYATYYQMKDRAGVVGSKGLAPVLATGRKANPTVRLHLVGHSFGARLVTAAASGLAPHSRDVTISLLQGAFSHNALSGDYGDGKPGFYRTVLADARVSGPVIITHTKNDQAVGVAYPLASRLAGEIAAALGDENDPYGGMGRNGAQHTTEATGHDATLGSVGHAYTFAAGTVNNLLADAVIKDHNDVTGGEVAYAVLCCTAGLG